MSYPKPQLNTNLLEDLNKKELTDCKFVFGDETLDAHKMVLACASPIFKSMFYGDLKEQGDIVIKDININTFRTLIKIIYGYSLYHGTQCYFEENDQACQLYYAAKKYEIVEAVDIARDYMLKELNSANAHRFYQTARIFEDHELVQRCCKELEESIYNATKTRGFFDNILPLQKDFTVKFEAAPTDATMNLYKILKEHRKNLVKLDSTEDLIENVLTTTRLLVLEVKVLFDLIIPRNVAQFKCSLNLMPQRISIKKVNKILSKIYDETPSNQGGIFRTHNVNSSYHQIGYKIRKYEAGVDLSDFSHEDMKELFLLCKQIP